MTLEEILKENHKDLTVEKHPSKNPEKAYLQGVITGLQICRKKYREDTLTLNDLTEEIMFYQEELEELTNADQ